VVHWSSEKAASGYTKDCLASDSDAVEIALLGAVVGHANVHIDGNLLYFA
jgi:hypothetical protein